MGSIHISGARFLESLCEHIGCKAGVALGRPELDTYLESEGFDDFVGLSDDAYAPSQMPCRQVLGVPGCLSN